MPHFISTLKTSVSFFGFIAWTTSLAPP